MLCSRADVHVNDVVAYQGSMVKRITSALPAHVAFKIGGAKVEFRCRLAYLVTANSDMMVEGLLGCQSRLLEVMSEIIKGDEIRPDK